MAHPLKSNAAEAHNAKLERMTTHYGAADPAMNKSAPVDKYKQNGPEEAVGFGADSGKTSPRSDRPGRKTTAANPIATYATGGRVAGRAMGGRLNRKSSSNKGTHVNIMIAPQQPQQPPPMPNPAALAAMAPPDASPAPKPPMGAGQLPLPAGAMPPGVTPPGLSPAVPPIPMRKRGGRLMAKHKDAVQDEALIHKVLREEGLERANKKYNFDEGRARGGRMTAGAGSGEGRLEKAAIRASRKSGDKAAEI